MKVFALPFPLALVGCGRPLAPATDLQVHRHGSAPIETNCHPFPAVPRLLMHSVEVVRDSVMVTLEYTAGHGCLYESHPCAEHDDANRGYAALYWDLGFGIGHFGATTHYKAPTVRPPASPFDVGDSLDTPRGAIPVTVTDTEFRFGFPLSWVGGLPASYGITIYGTNFLEESDPCNWPENEVAGRLIAGHGTQQGAGLDQ